MPRDRPHPGVSIHLEVNARPVAALVRPDQTLADLLREDLDLTGTKVGCEVGECGACTVLVDGRPMLSCLMLAVKADGRSVTTIEGVAAGQSLHPLQEAFIALDALQCGFCTPGQIMAALGLLSCEPSPSRDRVRRDLAGNLCRCGAYLRIEQAVLEASRAMRATRPRAPHP